MSLPKDIIYRLFPCDLWIIQNGGHQQPLKKSLKPPKSVTRKSLVVAWRIIPFSKWLITMVIVSPLSRVVGPLINGLFMAEINGGDPITTYIHWEPILQVVVLLSTIPGKPASPRHIRSLKCVIFTKTGPKTSYKWGEFCSDSLSNAMVSHHHCCTATTFMKGKFAKMLAALLCST